ncbi:hypothetical protein H4R26_001151 [Coemansia thaxteri]|uniref:Uncharacterized protein n=1 Tax=Coemansia thaxteri TaxID=2663907 RepID=A0A9W8BMH0_9FUNG|nr:hypothetical protein H4R26_001151 [Coemansia thaxteri]
MDDLRGTEAERMAADAAAAAGWRPISWPRVRMMSQSPDLDPAPAAVAPTPAAAWGQQRGAWAQVRRFVGEVTEVFGSRAGSTHGQAWSVEPSCQGETATATNAWTATAMAVAVWVLLVATDLAVTGAAMPRVVEWLVADMAEPEQPVRVFMAAAAAALTQPFAVQWLCFSVAALALLARRRGGRRRGLLAHAAYFAIADFALMAALGPSHAVCEDDGLAIPGHHVVAHTVLDRGLFAGVCHGGSPQQPDRRRPRRPVLPVLATAAMYATWGCCVRGRVGLRASALLLAADVGIRRSRHVTLPAATQAAGAASMLLAAHVVSAAALLGLRQAAGAMQAMRAWHGAVMRERRRGGPVILQAAGDRGLAGSRGPAGGAYAHRVCFLCLSGHCERCLLSVEKIWPRADHAALPAADHAGESATEHAPATVRASTRRRPPTVVSRRAVDVWVVSSVAHCPCRAVHGVGPSAFVRKPSEPLPPSLCRAERFAVPVGSMVGLQAYVRELRVLGLVQRASPVASASDDLAASVLPLIFGRFADQPPLSPPSSEPVRGSGAVPFLSDTRAVVAPTPLSQACVRPGSFRLVADDLRGAVRVTVAVTPALAHLLLIHPRSAPTAMVCVPAALLASSSTPSLSSTSKLPVTVPADLIDADPFFDYTRVQVARSDIVVRVNGARWHDYELGALALNQPIVINNLIPGQLYTVSLSIYDMQSEDLSVLFSPPAATFAAATPAQDDVEVLQALAADTERERVAATQHLKRVKREAPKALAQSRLQLESLRASLDRLAAAGLKLQTRRQHLEQSVDALRVSVQKLAEKSAGVSPKDSSTSSASPSHSRSSSLTTVCDNPSSPAPLKSDEALANLRRAEAAARRLRDDHEDVIQELKAERSRWMAQLSNGNCSGLSESESATAYTFYLGTVGDDELTTSSAAPQGPLPDRASFRTIVCAAVLALFALHIRL